MKLDPRKMWISPYWTLHGVDPDLHLRGAQDDEERVVVAFDLRSLMGRERVFDGEIVKAELFLHLSEQRLVGLEEPDPDEGVGPLEHVADVVERDVADAPAFRIGDAGDDGAG